MCMLLCYQLDEVERVIFCLFLHVDVHCYSVWLRKYFPLSADTFPADTGYTRQLDWCAVLDLHQRGGIFVLVCLPIFLSVNRII